MEWIFNLKQYLGKKLFLVFYPLYYKRLKRPLKIYVRKNYRSRGLRSDYSSYEQLKDLHMASFEISEYSDNPFAFSVILSPEKKVKICKNKLKSLREKISSYYMYTNGRIKPEDIYEMNILRKEIENYQTDNN
jgi:hypothetical protein